MAAYRLSPLARNDLEDIWLYTYEQWSAAQADQYYNDVMTMIERLASGEIRARHTDIRHGYWKYPVGKHLIFFRQLEAGIEIIRVLHQSMDFERHL